MGGIQTARRRSTSASSAVRIRSGTRVATGAAVFDVIGGVHALPVAARKAPTAIRSPTACGGAPARTTCAASARPGVVRAARAAQAAVRFGARRVRAAAGRAFGSAGRADAGTAATAGRSASAADSSPRSAPPNRPARAGAALAVVRRGPATRCERDGPEQNRPAKDVSHQRLPRLVRSTQHRIGQFVTARERTAERVPARAPAPVRSG